MSFLTPRDVSEITDTRPQSEEEPASLSPAGASIRVRHAGREVLLQQERLFKGETLQNSLSQSPLATAKFHFHFISRLLFCFVLCLFFFFPSKSGIRMEAGNIPWELRTMAENTKKCSEDPPVCQAHVICSEECRHRLWVLMGGQ